MILESIDKVLLKQSFQYYVMPIIYIISFQTRNFWVLIMIIYGIFPWLDYLFPLDEVNPSEEEAKELEEKVHFKIPLYLSIFLEWLICYEIYNGKVIQESSWFNLIGMCYMLGVSATSNINVAHELVHKDNKLDQVLGMLTLSKNLYMHFQIQHIKVHHKFVATPLDPSSAPLNQNLYSFIVQSVKGCWIAAWKYEHQRLQHCSPLSYLFYNKMTWYTLNNILLPLCVYHYYGLKQLLVFFSSAFISVMILEIVNYLEHYGLQRKEIRKGVYEKVNINHSWNAPQRISNYIMFKLQRHSDHHQNSYKSYQTLCTYKESPQLPQSYIIIMLCTLSPSFWFKLMNEYTMLYTQQKPIPKSLTNKIHYQIFNYITKTTICTIILAALGYVI